MMDCKNALSETNGDIEQAVDWLRKKGLAKAAKKSGRVAAEGLVGLAVKGNVGVVAEVNSETDFVARNDDFQALVRGVLAVALDHAPQVNVETVLGAHYPGGGTVSEAIANAIATIGENMTLRRAQGLSVAEGAIGHVCARVDCRWPGQNRGDRRAQVRPATRIGWRRSAASSRCMSPQRARSLWTPRGSSRRRSPASARCSPRRTPASPRTCSRRSSNSGLKTFYKEVCLVDQAYVHDPAKTVAQAIKEAEKTVGAPIAVTGFVRYALGEGVEKPVEGA